MTHNYLILVTEEKIEQDDVIRSPYMSYKFQQKTTSINAQATQKVGPTAQEK